MHDLDAALADATRSSGGGVGFLIAYGATLLIAGLLAFVLPVNIAALVILFQGGVALPLAFALERRLGFPPMAADNPLRSLSIQMAMTQVVALPAVIITYDLNPVYVPAVFAAIGGGHFLPYAWLHRTRVYVVLGVVISFGFLLLTVILKQAAFPYVPLFWAACYGVTALVLFRTVGQRARSNEPPR
ncbi:MAG: DUF7010 family protein [Chloroflexota bacterium]